LLFGQLTIIVEILAKTGKPRNVVGEEDKREDDAVGLLANVWIFICKESKAVSE